MFGGDGGGIVTGMGKGIGDRSWRIHGGTCPSCLCLVSYYA